MEAGQGEAGRRMVKGRRSPIGGGMARLAGLGEPSRRVRRIIRAIEVRLMAADAGRVRAGQVVVPVHVALRALQGSVRARQRESRGRVIEGCITPRRRGVALLTGGREVRLHVARIRRSVEVCLMAAHASGIRSGQVVIAIHVALRALQRRMRTSERESRGRVIEGCVTPRRRGVALLTGGREVRLHVIRIRRAVEIRLVAAYASRVCTGQVVIVIDVTLGALQRRVRAGEREARRGMIECRSSPRCCVVALLAGLREARRHVIRIRRALEVFQMAADASGIRAGQVVVVVDVTLGARNRRVRARQREAGG